MLTFTVFIHSIIHYHFQTVLVTGRTVNLTSQILTLNAKHTNLMIPNGADLYQVLRKAPQFAHEAHSTVLLGNESNTGPLLASLQVNCNVQDISLDHTRRLKERRCCTPVSG